MIVKLNNPSQPRNRNSPSHRRPRPHTPSRATPATTQYAARRRYKKPGISLHRGKRCRFRRNSAVVRKFRRTCSGCFGAVWWRGRSVNDSWLPPPRPTKPAPLGKPIPTGSTPPTHRCYVSKKSQLSAPGGWKAENRQLCEVIALALATAERTTSSGVLSKRR